MAHLSSARSCQWYRKGKNREEAYILPNCEDVAADQGIGSGSDAMEEDQEGFGDWESFHDVLERGEFFHFDLPAPTSQNARFQGEGDASSSTDTTSSTRGSRRFDVPVLDDDEDTRVVEEDETAGRVIRMERSIVETWKAYFSDDSASDDLDSEVPMDVDVEEGLHTDPNSKWKPFASELDWQVAKWVIREDVGQNSLNRLLGIPGVSYRPEECCS